MVWVPVESSAPGALLSGLAERSVTTTVVSEPARVMVELAGGGASVLIVAEPQVQSRMGELVSAVRRYYPGVAVWTYRERGGTGPQLARLDERNGSGRAAGGAASNGEGAGHAPAPEAGQRETDREEAGGRSPPGVTGLASLSHEELAMLLEP